MKLATIFYLHNLLICAKGGFIKNLLGTVTDGVHEVSHGIIESVSHTFDEAANVIEDMSNVLHIGKTTPKTSYSIQTQKPYTNWNKPEYSNTQTQVTTLATTKSSNVENNQAFPEKKIEKYTTLSEVKPTKEFDQNGGKDMVSENSNSQLNNLIENDSFDYNYGEDVISPRIARSIVTNI